MNTLGARLAKEFPAEDSGLTIRIRALSAGGGREREIRAAYFAGRGWPGPIDRLRQYREPASVAGHFSRREKLQCESRLGRRAPALSGNC